ncbi:MAG TPA: KR domain-containing protein, partial [Longimicrobium sp.]|nr:KR domain-containing protein [Longimicrobium sp.]
SSDGHLRVMRIHSREDHRALADSLAADEFRADVVVDARPADADPADAFGALLLLADVLPEAKLVVVTRNAQEVTGGESVDPRAAAILGACASLPREYPKLACRAIDVADAGAAALVAADVRSGSDARVSAYRGRHRWTRAFHPLRASSSSSIREGGAYLLMGEALGRNGRLAEALAATPGVGIALAALSIPDKLVRNLEAAGATVLAMEVDPTDGAALKDAVARTEARFGRLDGVMYSPELGEAGALALVSDARPAEWGAQVAAVADSLAALEAALEGRALDFCLVESSLAGVLGVVGRVRHAAANALTDAYAARSGRMTSVAWDRWMAADEPEGDTGGLKDTEISAALERILALAAQPLVLVSTVELEHRVKTSAAPKPQAASTQTLYARPEAAGSYAAPTNEVEEQLAELWQELLGIERVGIDDDFFGLGGHSLLATQIVSRVRSMFRIDLRLAAIFEAPTVARMAALIEDAIIAELEALSDEEAAELVGR